MSEEKRNLLSIGDASEYLGVSIDTLRRWEDKGKVTAYRSPGNHRYFDKSDLDSLFGTKYERTEEVTPRKIDKTNGKVESSEQDAVVHTDLMRPEYIKILDRETREVQIPGPVSIRVIQSETITENVQVSSQEIQTPQPEQANESILIPQRPASVPSSPPDHKAGKPIQSASQKLDFKLIMIIAATVLIVAMAAVVSYVALTTPKIISPLP